MSKTQCLVTAFLMLSLCQPPRSLAASQPPHRQGKDTFFRFYYRPLDGILRSMSRSYKARLQFEGPPPKQRVTVIGPRPATMQGQMAMLQHFGVLHYRLQNGTIIVSSI